MHNVEDTMEVGQEVDPKELMGETMYVKALINFDYKSVSPNSVRLRILSEEVNFRRLKKKKRIMSNAVATPLKK